jgi:transcriptional regulator with XRE-family HTH domain
MLPRMTTTAYRAMREATGLSLRELSRRTGWIEGADVQAPGTINPGRLSLLERGLDPTPAEDATLKRLLAAELTGTTEAVA